MKKLIEKLFGVRIVSKAAYSRLTSAVAECGKTYREHAGDNYHNGDLTANVKLSDMSKICLAENAIRDMG